MKKAILISLLITSSMFAQWTQTGPVGFEAVSLAASNEGAIYAGTRTSGGKGFGIFKSANNGASWENISSNLAQSQNLYGEIIDIIPRGDTILICYRHPSNSAPTVYRTLDGGASWSVSNTGITTNISDLLETPDAVYAGGVNTIFKSTDFGANWTEIYKYQHTFNWDISGLEYFNGKIFATNPWISSSDNGVTWGNTPLIGSSVGGAFVVRHYKGDTVFAGTTYGIFKSTDNGTTWSDASTGLTGSRRIERMGIAGDLIIASDQDLLWKSTDGGSTWIEMTEYMPGDRNRYLNCLLYTNNTIFMGIEIYGIFRSTDNGNLWHTVHKGLPGLYNFNCLASNGSVILAGSGGSVFYRSTDEGETWLQTSGGVSGTLSVNALIMKDSFALAGSSAGTSVYRSTDAGITWTSSTNGMNAHVRGFTFVGDVILAGTNKGMFRSTDNGLTWNLVDISPFNNPSGVFLVVGSDVYAGTRDNSNIVGELIKSSDTGQTWNRVAADSIMSAVNGIVAYGNSIIVVESGYVFVTPKGNIWRSDDNGATWYKVMNGLPAYDQGLTGLVNADGTLYTSSYSIWVRDMYASTNGGIDWFVATEGMQKDFSGVNSFAMTNENLFVALAGTGQYGIYKRPLNSIPSDVEDNKIIPDKFSLDQNYPNPFNPSTNFRFSIPEAGVVTLKIYNSIGAEVATVVNDNLSAGEHNYSWNAGSLASGVYFYRLQSKANTVTKKLILMK